MTFKEHIDTWLIMLGVPLFFKMYRREFMFPSDITGKPVYRFYDAWEDRYYMAEHERSRFRVAFDELAYKEPLP